MFTRKMIRPVIKKKKVLFIAMILIVAIASFLSTGFSTAYYAFKKNATNFFNEYAYPDITLVAKNSFADKSKVEEIKNIEGVETFDTRATFYKAMYRNGGYKTIKVTSFNENSFTKFYALDAGGASKEYTNLYVDFVFANHNNITIGSKIDLYGKGGEESKIRINAQKIIATPETSHAMLQHQYEVDSYNFGFMFGEESVLQSAFGSDFGYNEIVVKLKSGYSQSVVADKIKTLLTSKEITVATTVLKDNSPVVSYMFHSILDNFKTIAITVPLIFVLITLLLLALFQYEIAKSMTREMGILNAIGVKKKSLFNLLLRFNLRVSAIGLVVGVAGGFGFANIIYNICKYSYGMPIGFANFNIYVSLVILGIFIAIAVITSLLALFSIRKLSPKEAMVNANDKNKPLPKGLDNLTKRSTSLNLACNSMHKNKARFFVSLFAIIIATAVTYGGISYANNSNAFVNEFGERLRYDAQVFNTSNTSGNIETIKEKIKQYTTQCEYTYSNDIKFNFNGKSYSTSVSAIDPNTDLVYIPGALKPTGNGIILESDYSKKAGIKAGDYIEVSINNTIKKLKVDGISTIYSSECGYMSINAYESFFKVGEEILGNKSLLIKYDWKNQNNIYKVSVENEGLPLFTAEAIATYTRGAKLVIIVAYVCAGVSLLIALVTILIMCNASLEDQKRKLSTLRVLGFTEKKTYKVFRSEVLTYLILGLIPGIPAGIGLNYLLAKLATTETFDMPVFNVWWIFLITIAFIILIVLFNLLIGKRKIKKWDIAENTRSKE